MYDFKSLTASTKFLSYKEWPVGQYVVGQVQRFQPNKKNAKNMDVIIKIIESNVVTDKVTLSEGELFTVNGTTALQKVVDSIEAGDILKVTYLGQYTVKGGEWAGSKGNKLDIQVAPAQDAANFGKKSEDNSDELI